MSVNGLTPRLTATLAAQMVALRLTQFARVLHANTENLNGNAQTAFPPTGPILQCRVAPPKGRQEAIEGEQVQATSDAQLLLPRGTIIDPADRIAVGPDRFLRDGSLLQCSIYSVSGPTDAGRANPLVVSVPIVRVI